MNRIVFGSLMLPFLASLPAAAASVTFSASGASPADIQSTLDSFRTALGTLNPNVAGSLGTGRREINWDGVPANFSSPNAFPANFFNSNSPRSAAFSTSGTGFEVSGTVPAPVRFENLNLTYSSTFTTFSAPRLFTATGSNVLDVLFFVPGSSTAATTSAFGAVFKDVDLSNITSLEFFGPSNNSLGLFYAPTANNGLSFLGVSFNAGELVSRVRITSGNTALGPSDAPGTDVVAMDDFIYAEPTAVPGPSTYLLFSSGLACLLLRCYQSRRS
jgi:hypothetical protein